MKRFHSLHIVLLAAMFALFPGRLTPAQNEVAETEVPEKKHVVYVIPIQGMIENALLYVIRRGASQAEAVAADAIIFDMNTPGGTIAAAEEIIRNIENLSVPTYTFVNNNAISAGAIIAMATDHIYMTPGSKIGDAQPIMMTPFGGPVEMNEAMEEKSLSYVTALIRAAAQQNGHDVKVAEAMVRRDLEYKIDDEIISPKGQLLTLTNVDAERLVGEEQRPLLSRGTVQDIDELLERIGLAGAHTETMVVTEAERVARFIAMLAPLFLMAGLLGIYIEIKTPGFGVPGILGAISLVVFFWGHHIAGLAGMEELVLLVIGISLILIEILVIPGFGLTGITGLMLVLWALLSAMIRKYPGGPWMPSIPQLQFPLLKLSLSLVLTFMGAIILGRFLPKSSLFNRLVLAEATHHDKGYEASPSTTSALIGRAGLTLSDLRPSGSAMFDELKLDVITRGEFIPPQTRVRIVETHGNRIIVESCTS